MKDQLTCVQTKDKISEQTRDGTVLAFDFGEKRIGVAVGNSLLGQAQPLVTVDSVATAQRFATIAQLIETWCPVLLVVGLPIHADGKAHELTHLSQRFARRLAARFKIKVILIDERYTSEMASVALREAGVTGKKQKPLLDQIAAQQILQAFFDEKHTAT
ncbi:MAG: Holliday junction resolvase RuvX [Betaproteobacteria bacterium]|nr:Holliday junction resolvase RuvX [Betaproteobacteria bacterium]